MAFIRHSEDTSGRDNSRLLLVVTAGTNMVIADMLEVYKICVFLGY